MMSKKKCLMIIIVSLVLIAAETLSYFLFVKPGMSMDDFYKAADSGNPDKLIEAYDKLSEDDKEEAIAMLKDMAVSITNKYLDTGSSGAISYDEFVEKLWPVVNLAGKLENESDKAADGLVELLNRCFFHANCIYVPEQFEEAVMARKDGDLKKAEDNAGAYGKARRLEYGDYGAEQSSILAYKGSFAKYRDGIDERLGQLIEDKYKAFTDGKLDKESMDAYIKVAEILFYDEAKERLAQIEEKYSVVGDYDKYLAEQEELLNKEEYIEVIQNIDKIMTEKKDDALFKSCAESFKTLRDRAYEEGKQTYPEQLYNLIKDGNIFEVEGKIKEIKAVYGNDINLDQVEDFLRNEWKTAYYTYMQHWEVSLNLAVENGQYIGEYNNSADINMDSAKPDLMTLVDLDGGGVPELILHNSRNGYSFILTYTDGRLVFSGCLKVLSYGNDTSFIIAEPYSGSAGAAAVKRELCHFNQSDGTIYVDRVIFRNRDYSYVNIDGVEYGAGNSGGGDAIGNTPTDKFENALKEIENVSNDRGSDPDPSGSVTVSRYFEYIYNYESKTN